MDVGSNGIGGRAPRLLAVEDDEDLRALFHAAFAQSGWQVHTAATEEEGIAVASTCDPDVVMLDLGLGAGTGRAVLDTLKANDDTAWVPVVVVSGIDDRDQIAALLHGGAQDFVRKPWHQGELEARLQAALRVTAEHRALRAAELQNRTVFESAPVGMAQLDLDGIFVAVNRALCALLGRSPEELVGRANSDFTHPDDVSRTRDGLRRIVDTDAILSGEKRFVRADGTTIWVAVSATRLVDADQQVTRILSHYVDVTDRKARETELVHLAETDPLTGLANRRTFDAELEFHLRPTIEIREGGALLLIDLDHFKAINDRLGHQTGDDVLTALARLLRRRLRGSDVIARLGGDEFAIVLPDVNESQAEHVARQLLNAIPNEVTVPGLRVTASIGIAMLDPLRSASELMEHADRSMYAAKQAGRNQVASRPSRD